MFVPHKDRLIYMLRYASLSPITHDENTLRCDLGAYVSCVGHRILGWSPDFWQSTTVDGSVVRARVDRDGSLWGRLSLPDPRPEALPLSIAPD